MQINIQKLTENISRLSKDGSTKVSATLLNSFGSVVSYGYNGLPRGMDDEDLTYQNKDQSKGIFYKYDLFEHAERNCLYNYARNNTKLGENGVFAIVSVIKSIEDFRALISSGVKEIYFHRFDEKLTKDKINVIFHMASGKGANVELTCINGQEYINKLFKTNPFSEHELMTMETVFNQNGVKKIIDVYHVIEDSFHSNEDNKEKQFCAFFANDFSLISIGTYGFSDYLEQSIKFSNLESVTINDSVYNEINIDLDTYVLDYHHQGKHYKFNVGQSAVKNAIYNLLAPIFVGKNFKINVTLVPCIYCAIGLFSCGIWSSNINVSGFSKTKTTSNRWAEENVVASIFEKLFFVNC